MLLILSENTDVYFNLAAEEYILHNFTEDVLMFWRSQSAVVCGKHQNLCAEINYGFCRENGIQIARRLTGGGTVYHDMGNINFTFIQNLKEGLSKAVNFRQFLDPVKDSLLSLGVETEYSNRNDLLLNGKKISGNAEHIFQQQKRVLHHGTLLFDSDLSDLKNALHADGTYLDKAVKSVRSEVSNIKTILKDKSADHFLQDLISYWKKQNSTISFHFSNSDIDKINTIQTDKYSTAAWILQYSPSYSVDKIVFKNNQEFNLHIEIKSGKIEELEINDGLNEKLPLDFISNYKDAFLSEKVSADFAEALSREGFSANPYILL